MHTLLFHEPGHFHAALLLRAPNARVDPTVHVYAAEGPELEAFTALIRSFNARAEAPTAWDLQIHAGPGALERLIAERRGDIAVVAGRNDGKLRTIRALHDAGLHTLADKPWITASDALPDLDAVTAGPPLAIDIMTNRHETMARLRREIVATPPVFGIFIDDPDRPAVEFGSVHHLYKTVNGEPLMRPAWYYDTGVQGDGLVDTHSHMTDQAQWLIDPDDSADYARDVAIDSARRWRTTVPLDLFSESTGLAAYPESLAHDVVDGVLQIACNGQIDYRLKGVRVRQRAEWAQRQPDGGGDIHSADLRGTGCEIAVRQGPETGGRSALHLSGGNGLESRIAAALPGWQKTFPGLECRSSAQGFELVLPDALRLGHEGQFPLVLDRFLGRVEAGSWPAALARRIRTRYTLIARAREVA